MLAGTDRLDKPLTIGQMQGKYQLHVFAETGHFVQEDIPVGLAKLVSNAAPCMSLANGSLSSFGSATSGSTLQRFELPTCPARR